MYKKNKILCIIPARGGSKSIPGKNIKLLCGKPLISYAINAARSSKYVDRTVVSTDDKEIARVAKKYKAEVPFIRPAELATDEAPMLPVIQHALGYLIEREAYTPDVVVLIHLTSPFVLPEDLDSAIEKLFKSKSNSCVTICPVKERPEFMFLPSMKLFMDTRYKTARRQELKPLFLLSGAANITRIKVLMEKNKFLDFNSLCGVEIPIERSIDIDEPLDFIIAEAIAKKLFQI